MVLILVVHAALVGLFVGALIFTFTGSVGWSIGVGVVLAIASFAGWMVRGYRGYRDVWRSHVPLRPTSETPA